MCENGEKSSSNRRVPGFPSFSPPLRQSIHLTWSIRKYGPPKDFVTASSARLITSKQGRSPWRTNRRLATANISSGPKLSNISNLGSDMKLLWLGLVVNISNSYSIHSIVDGGYIYIVGGYKPTYDFYLRLPMYAKFLSSFAELPFQAERTTVLAWERFFTFYEL